MSFKCIAAPLIACCFGAVAARAQDTSDRTLKGEWKVVGLAVTKPGPPDVKLGVSVRDGVQLTAILRLPMRTIVVVDEMQSKISTFTDDKGTDLFKTAAVRVRPPRIVSEEAISGEYAKLIFHAPSSPARTATRIRVKGAVALMVGEKEEVVKKQDVSLKKGIDLGFGIVQLNDRPIGDLNSAIYKGSRPLKLANFFTITDREIPVRTNSSSLVNRNAAKGEFSTYFHGLPRGIDRCTLHVTYFERLEQVILPVELDVGLDL